MPKSRDAHIDVAAPPDVALRALHDAISAMANDDSVQVDGWVVTGTVGVGVRSWGEKLTGRVLTGPGGTRIEVQSKSRLATQVIDWGKHKKNLDRVLSQLQSLGQPPG